jgi:hypothetical protein
LQQKSPSQTAKRNEETEKGSGEENKGRSKVRASGNETRVCFDWENGLSQSDSTTVFGRTKVEILNESQQIYSDFNLWALSYQLASSH